MSNLVKLRSISGATRISLANVMYEIKDGIVEVPKANYKDLLCHGFILIKEQKVIRSVGRPPKQKDLNV